MWAWCLSYLILLPGMWAVSTTYYYLQKSEEWSKVVSCTFLWEVCDYFNYMLLALRRNRVGWFPQVRRSCLSLSHCSAECSPSWVHCSDCIPHLRWCTNWQRLRNTCLHQFKFFSPLVLLWFPCGPRSRWPTSQTGFKGECKVMVHGFLRTFQYSFQTKELTKPSCGCLKNTPLMYYLFMVILLT